MPPAKRKVIRQEVDAVLHDGIIEPYASPWSAPVVLVQKKDGGRIFCIDYRALNSVTKKHVYPLPRADDILESMSTAHYFSHFDLVRGYWQFQIAVEDQEETAFTTPDGHYHFRKMSFGLTNAPATFQREMDTILKGLLWTDCLVYLDDIVIFASSLEEHLSKLDQVFTLLGEAGLKVKPEKCSILPKEMKLLGHVVSMDGTKVDPDKIQVILDWPVSTCLSELKSFLGHGGYHQKFIQNYADITDPLRKLDKKGSHFLWDAACESAFQTMKTLLTNSPVLAYPDFNLPFIVDCDASDNGVGASLSQIQDGIERPIAFAAKALHGAQRNYTVYQKEMLALTWALDHFEPYIYSHEYEQITKHFLG